MSYELTYTGSGEPVKTIMHNVRVEWGNEGDEEEVMLVEMQYPSDSYPYVFCAWDWAQGEPAVEVIEALDLVSPRKLHEFLQECVALIEKENQ